MNARKIVTSIRRKMRRVAMVWDLISAGVNRAAMRSESSRDRVLFLVKVSMAILLK